VVDPAETKTVLREVLERAAMVVASVLLVLVLVELGMRVFGAAPLPKTAAGGFRPEHPLLRLLRPNECKDVGSPDGPYFIEVCTNRLGLRDREHVAGEAPRVIGLGDSFTFGWGVDQHDTFVTHLERALRLALPTVRPGVWNAGLSYTSQVHQDVLLRHLYDKVHPDAVVLAFSEDNDIDENIVWNPNLGVFPERGEIPAAEVNAYRDAYRGVVFQDFLFRHSALVRFMRQRQLRSSMAAEAAALDSRLQAHGFTGAPLSRMVVDEARRRFLQAFSHKYDDDWRVTEILLERIRTYVADRGGRLVLLRVPSRVAVEDSAWSSARRRFCGPDTATSQKLCGTLDRGHTATRLAAYARSHGLAYVDPESTLHAAADRGETLFLPEDIHLSRLGHARVGEQLAESVVPLLGGKKPDSSSSAPQKRRQVGAYWYPWYRGEDWTSFTDYTPKGGAYISDQAPVIGRHVQQAERGEIDFLMIELLADHNPESKFNDRAVDGMVNAIVERRKRGFSKLEFAVMTDIYVGEADIMTGDRWLEVTRRHLNQIWTRFVEPHPDAYVKVDGKPLLGIFSPAAPIDDSRFTIVRPYWVSHEQWKDWDRKKELVPFWDTAPQTVTDPRFVSVIPGYNDWRLERQPQVGPYLPRLGGRTFVEQWRRVFEVDPQVVLVYSFNEFYEQTQIQPTVEQGDRYLVLNQLLARRFKDGRPLSDADSGRLVDVVEPSAQVGEEKVAWLPLSDPRVTMRGFEAREPGRHAFRDQAELEFDVESEQAFVVGIAHPPTFERCAGMSVTIVGAGEEKTDVFGTELTQLSILRDSPMAKNVNHLKLVLRRVPGKPDCRDSGERPITITGITRYPLSTSERLNIRVDDPKVRLEGFWEVEAPPAGSFAWSRERSLVSITGLTPGVRHKVTLAFRDTAGFGNVDIGPDQEHLQHVVITPGRTATYPDPLMVLSDGTLTIAIKSPTWRPHERFNSEDPRTLGMALRLVTLDRVEGVTSPHERR
jgi:hypothetical protein